MATQFLYLTASNFEAARDHFRNCANCPVEFTDSQMDEIAELDAQIAADLLDLDDVGLDLVDWDISLDCDAHGRIWAEVYVETTDNDGEPTGDCEPRRIQVLPQPLPGSLYDPALDPNNCWVPVGSEVPEHIDEVVVVLQPLRAMLLRNCLDDLLAAIDDGTSVAARERWLSPNRLSVLRETLGQLQDARRGSR